MFSDDVLQNVAPTMTTTHSITSKKWRSWVTQLKFHLLLRMHVGNRERCTSLQCNLVGIFLKLTSVLLCCTPTEVHLYWL